MAGNNSEDASHVHNSDVDWLVINGEEYLAYPYSGCSKCSTTEERLPFYEVSMKESLEGKKRKYPLRNISVNSHPDISSSCIADHLKNLTNQLKVSKDSDCPTHSFDEFNISKPKPHELERIINTIEVYVSSLKSKLKKYKRNEFYQSGGSRLEPLDEVTEEREDEPVPENDEIVVSGDEIESTGDEITLVTNDFSDERTVMRNESSDAGSEMRNTSSVKGKAKNYESGKVRKDEAVSADQETESSESETESSSDENESVDVESCKSSDEELSKVKKNEHKQKRLTQRKDLSPSKDISYVYDNDGSYAELEIHSGVHGSSSVKGRISIRKHHIIDEDESEDNRSKDTEEQQPPKKRKCLGPEEESPVWHSPSECGEDFPTTGSQRSVESGTTESSLYETAKEMSSQASEVLYDSSGSATP